MSKTLIEIKYNKLKLFLYPAELFNSLSPAVLVAGIRRGKTILSARQVHKINIKSEV